jgi:uncharacterized RDD family membrane protein YckC
MEEREPSMLKPDRLSAGVTGGGVSTASASSPRPPVARAHPAAPLVHVAGFWRRTAAALVDVLLVVPVSYLLTMLAARVAGLSLPPARRTGIDYWLDLALAGDPGLWGGLGLGAFLIVLYLYLWQVTTGRTPGMRLLGLRVIDLYGEPPGVVRSAVRTLGYLVSLATLSLGFLWVAFDREKRGLHDWLAGTLVTKNPPAGKHKP